MPTPSGSTPSSPRWLPSSAPPTALQPSSRATSLPSCRPASKVCSIDFTALWRSTLPIWTTCCTHSRSPSSPRPDRGPRADRKPCLPTDNWPLFVGGIVQVTFDAAPLLVLGGDDASTSRSLLLGLDAQVRRKWHVPERRS